MPSCPPGFSRKVVPSKQVKIEEMLSKTTTTTTATSNNIIRVYLKQRLNIKVTNNRKKSQE
jgi:hypothetical protein